MSEITFGTVGLFVGFFALIFFCFVAIIAPDRHRKGKKYDERQILARYQAYKYSFVFMILYFTVCAFLEISEIKWALTAVILFIGILGSIALFVIVCIIKDAYNDWFTRKNKPYDFLFFNLFYGLLELGKFFWNIYKGDSILDDGMINGNIMELVFAVLFLGIFIAKVINTLIKKADGEE